MNRLGPHTLRRANAIVGIAVLIAAATSCSNDGTKLVKNQLGPTLTRLSAPSVTGALSGTVTLNGKRAPIEGAWSGSNLDDASRAKITGSVPTAAPILFDIRWSDGSVISARKESPGLNRGVWPSSLVAGSQQAVSVGLLKVSFLHRALEPLFPAALLSRLQSGKPNNIANTTEAGRASRRYTYAYVNPMLQGTSEIRVVISGKDRLERVTITQKFGPDTMTLDYKVSLDQGKPLDIDMSVAPSVDPEVKLAPTGPFAAVRSGVTADLTWEILRARSKPGIECWRVRTTPAITVNSPNFQSDTRCTAKVSATDDDTEHAQFVLSSNGATASAITLVRLTPGASKARFGFAGGRMVDAVIANDLVVWAGPNDDHPAYFEVTLKSGTSIGCGLGALSTRADLRDDRLTASSIAMAWTCDPLN